MGKKSMAITILLLRILALLFLVGSTAILVFNTVKIPGSDDLTFRSFYAYRYVLSVDAIGGVYLIAQILLWAVNIGMRIYFSSKLNIMLHQLCDLVFALFFATGFGAGFWLTYDVKKQIDKNGDNKLIPGIDKYFNLVYISTGLLLLASITVAAVILCSTHVLARK